MCALLEGAVASGSQQTLTYPNNLVLGPTGLPNQSCHQGEHVKFNRLRPLMLKFSLANLTNFKTNKIKIYFLENHASEAYLLKELSLP